MKDKLINLAALLAIAIPLGTILDGAKAQQTVVWTALSSISISNCAANGAAWEEKGNFCHWPPPVDAKWKFTEQAPGVTSSTYATSAAMPTCEEGWTLVADQSMHPMCARELKEPKR